MAKSNRYNISFGTSDPEIANWIKAQNNKTASISMVIRSFIFDHPGAETTDIFEYLLKVAKNKDRENRESIAFDEDSVEEANESDELEEPNYTSIKSKTTNKPKEKAKPASKAKPKSKPKSKKTEDKKEEKPDKEKKNLFDKKGFEYLGDFS